MLHKSFRDQLRHALALMHQWRRRSIQGVSLPIVQVAPCPVMSPFLSGHLYFSISFFYLPFQKLLKTTRRQP